MSDVLLAVGTSKGLFLARSDGSRRTWQMAPPSFLMNAIYSVGFDLRGSTPRLLVGADSPHWGPSVFTSEDLGATWSEPEKGAIAFPADTGASLARVWQLTPSLTEPGVVWAGVEPSALFRSDDGGEHFALIHGLWDHPHREHWRPGAGGQALHTVLPDPADSRAITVAMSTGGVYRSADGGDSWNPANRGIWAGFMPEPEPEFGQCVHKVARNAARPEQLFLQNHGGVFRSDNGGERWISIAEGLPADFGFAMVAHPQRPGVAYNFPLVADAERLPPDRRCRVYRTEDAGRTWTALADGLPQQDYFDIVLRDAMCADDADPVGVYFGTRDGELYASADEGDHWSQVAAHLPSVLCVRAAVVG
jgi:hypothetical protein